MASKAWDTRLPGLFLRPWVASPVPMGVSLFLLVVGGSCIRMSPPAITVSPTVPNIWGSFLALTLRRFSGDMVVRRHRECGGSLTRVVSSSVGTPLFGAISRSPLDVLAFCALDFSL